MRGIKQVCWWGIVTLSAACASVVLGGAVATLVSGGVGAGMPGSLLDGEAGALLTVPDLVVLIELGGLQLFVLLLMLTHRGGALRWSTMARVGRVIGVGVVAAALAGYGILLAAVVMSGLMELAFTLSLLAILPRVSKQKEEVPLKQDVFEAKNLRGLVGSGENTVENQRSLFVGDLLSEREF